MAIVPYNYQSSRPSQSPATQLTNWADWGGERCDDASKIGPTMFAAGTIAKNSNLGVAGILLALVPQFIKGIFFPHEG